MLFAIAARNPSQMETPASTTRVENPSMAQSLNLLRTRYRTSHTSVPPLHAIADMVRAQTSEDRSRWTLPTVQHS